MKLFSAAIAIFLFSVGLWSEQFPKKIINNFYGVHGCTPSIMIIGTPLSPNYIYTQYVKHPNLE